jgi:ADP-heptose:LPS heptosyltransferase
VTLVPDVRRIGVLRATALGDFVFALPALDALRAAYPGSEIVLLGREWHRQLLDGRPSPVDRVVALPEGFIGDEPARLPSGERERLLASLRREGWDVVLQMHGGGRNSNPVARALGARVTAGTATPDAMRLDRVVPYVYWQNEAARCLEVAGLVGAVPVTLQPRLAVTDEDLARSRRSLDDDGRRILVLHPGATDARRRWPVERFAEVGRTMAGEGFRVVVTGTDDEAALTAAVAGAIGPDAVDVGGRLDLSALVGLLSRAAIVVSNDTGPLHVADAIGTPSVGIFWAGNAINGGPPFRSRHRPLLSWRVTCSVCGAHSMAARCPHDESWVDDVSVGDVLTAAAELAGDNGRVAAESAA